MNYSVELDWSGYVHDRPELQDTIQYLVDIINAVGSQGYMDDVFQKLDEVGIHYTKKERE